MASIGRQVADAFIEIHGDLAPFRKQLDRAGGLVDNFGRKLRGLGGLNVLEDSFRYGIQFMQNIDRNAVRLGQMVTGIGALAGSITSLLGATAVIGQDIAALSGIGLLAPAFLTGFGIAMGVTIAALKDMKVVLADLGPQFNQLQDSISAEFWAQAEQPIRNLVSNLMPTLQVQLKATAKAMGGLFAEFADSLRSEATPERVTGMFVKLNEAIDISRAAIRPFTAAMVTLGEHGSKYFARFAEGIVTVSKQFNDFIQRSAQNGDLERWTEAAIQGFKDLGSIIVSSVKIIGSIGDAARAAGIGGLSEMRDRLQAASDIMNSPRFQTALTSFFRGAKAATDGVVAGIGRLGPALETAMPTIEAVFGNIGRAAERIGGIIAGIVSNPQFLAGFEKFSAGIVRALDELAPAVEPFANSLGSLLDLMSEVLVATARLASAVMQHLGPIFDQIGGNLQRLVGPLSETLVGIVEALAPVFQSLNDHVMVPLVDILTVHVLPLIGKIIDDLAPILTLALEVVGDVLDDLVPAFEGLNKQFDTFNGQEFADTLRDVLGVIDAVIASASSDVSLFEWLNSEPVRQFNADVNAALAEFWAQVTGNVERLNAEVNANLAAFWGGIGAQLATFGAEFAAGWNAFWGGLGTGIATIWADIQMQFTNAWLQLTTGFNAWVAEFQAGWDTFWGGIGEGLNLIWTGIVTLLTVWWNQITEGFNNTFVVPFNQFWDAFWNGLDPKLRAILEGIGAAIQAGWNSIITGAQSFFANFGSGWNGMWADIGAANAQKWRETVDGFNTWANNINTTVRNFINTVMGAWNSFWADVANGFRRSWEETVNGFNTWANSINTTVRNFINTVMGDWNRFWGDLFNQASNGWNQMIGGFNNWAASINATVNGFINNVMGQWNGFWANLFGQAANGWNQMIGGFNNWAANINNTVRGFINSAIASLGSFWNTIVSAARAMMGVFVADIQNRLNAVGAVFRALPGIVGNALAGFANQLYNIGVNAISSLARAIAGGAGRIISAITGAIGGAIATAKRLLGIASPSKVFALMGHQTGEGYAGGVESTERMVERSVEGIAAAAIGVLAKSEMFTAGANAALGLADGLASNKTKVATALGGVSLDMAATTRMGTLPGNAGTVGIPTATSGTTTSLSIAEGAIQVAAPQSDGALVAKKVLDDIVETFG